MRVRAWLVRFALTWGFEAFQLVRLIVNTCGALGIPWRWFA